MSKLEDARKILTALQVPKEQRNDMCCYVLIVLAGIDEDGKWEQANKQVYADTRYSFKDKDRLQCRVC